MCDRAAGLASRRSAEEYVPSVHSFVSTGTVSGLRPGESLYRREVEARARHQAKCAPCWLEHGASTTYHTAASAGHGPA